MRFPATKTARGGFTILDNMFAGAIVAVCLYALYAINSIATPVSVENLRIQRRTPDTRSYDVDLTCIALARDA